MHSLAYKYFDTSKANRIRVFISAGSCWVFFTDDLDNRNDKTRSEIVELIWFIPLLFSTFNKVVLL